MAFYQNHVAKLCERAGIRLSPSGCPLLGPTQAGIALELDQAAPAGPVPPDFDARVKSAMAETAIRMLLEDSPKASPFAQRLYVEEVTTAKELNDVIPIRVRLAQQSSLRAIYNSLSAALLLKGRSNLGEPSLQLVRAFSQFHICCCEVCITVVIMYISY